MDLDLGRYLTRMLSNTHLCQLWLWIKPPVACRCIGTDAQLEQRLWYYTLLNTVYNQMCSWYQSVRFYSLQRLSLLVKLDRTGHSEDHLHLRWCTYAKWGVQKYRNKDCHWDQSLQPAMYGFNQLNAPSLSLTLQACVRTYGGCWVPRGLHEKEVGKAVDLSFSCLTLWSSVMKITTCTHCPLVTRLYFHSTSNIFQE